MAEAESFLCISFFMGWVWEMKILILEAFSLYFFNTLYTHYANKFNPDEATSGDNPDADPMDLLLLCSDNSPAPQSSPPPPRPISPSLHSSHSPSKLRSRIWPHTPTGRSQRGRTGRGQLFDDPAVVKTVEGRPSLKVYVPDVHFRNVGGKIN